MNGGGTAGEYDCPVGTCVGFSTKPRRKVGWESRRDSWNDHLSLPRAEDKIKYFFCCFLGKVLPGHGPLCVREGGRDVGRDLSGYRLTSEAVDTCRETTWWNLSRSRVICNGREIPDFPGTDLGSFLRSRWWGRSSIWIGPLGPSWVLGVRESLSWTRMYVSDSYSDSDLSLFSIPLLVSWLSFRFYENFHVNSVSLMAVACDKMQRKWSEMISFCICGWVLEFFSFISHVLQRSWMS